MTPVALAAGVLALAVLVWPRHPRAERLGGPEGLAGFGAPGHLGGGEGHPRPGTRGSDRRWPWSRARGRRTVDGAVGVDGGVLTLLDALGPALRAGLPPADALRAVAPGAPGRPAPLDTAVRVSAAGGPVPRFLADLLAAADRGEDLSLVWRDRATRSESSDLALVASAWALCERLGSPLAATVTTVAAVLRRRTEVDRRTAAALAGPRASMTVLTALPAVGPLLALVMGLSPLDLYASPTGAASLVLGLLLLLVGRWWGARLIRSIGAGAGAGAGADAGGGVGGGVVRGARRRARGSGG